MLTLLDLVAPFAPGDRVRWIPGRGFTDRTYTVTTITEAGGRWALTATGPKKTQRIRTVWPVGTRPRIEAAR